MPFFVLILSLFLSACTVTNINDNYAQTVSSWRWAKEYALLQNWGRPNKIDKLPNGNTLFIYHKESYKTYPSSTLTSEFAAVSVQGGRNISIVPTSSQPAPNPTYFLECSTFFEIDPRKIIVDVRASGNNCTGDEGFMLSRSNPHPVAQAKKK